MTPYLLSNGHQGDAQAKINDLHQMNEQLERELAAERALADRLAEAAEQVLMSLRLNHDQGIGIGPRVKTKSALAAWKEARDEA